MIIEFKVRINVPVGLGCTVSDWTDKITRDLQYEYRGAEVYFIGGEDDDHE